MRCAVAIILCAVTGTAATAAAPPRVWIADQGNNQVGSNNPSNRILEIDPLNARTPPDPDGTDVIILNTLPSPAGAFLDELSFDDSERLWTVVKDDSDQEPDGARRIDKDTGAVQVSITPTFPGEGPGSLVYLEGLAWDGSGLWLTGVQQIGGPNLLTRVDPATGNRITPFDTGAGKADIPGNVAQGLLYDPSGSGYLWHSDVSQRKIYQLDVADNFAVVKTFSVPQFPPKGMDFMGAKVWVAAPFSGIWEIDPAAADGSDGNAVRKFSTPSWNLDGIAILNDPGPSIELSTSTLTPTAWIGSNPPADTFTVRNRGNGTMDYQISDDVSWLSSDPDDGDSTGEADTITVTYTGIAGFTAGVYPATITVDSTAASNAPQTIAVTLTVRTVGPDLDGDGDVDLDDFARLQACFMPPAAAGQVDDPACENADLNHDDIVGPADLDVFFQCLSAKGIPALQGCDD